MIQSGRITKESVIRHDDDGETVSKKLDGQFTELSSATEGKEGFQVDFTVNVVYDANDPATAVKAHRLLINTAMVNAIALAEQHGVFILDTGYWKAGGLTDLEGERMVALNITLRLGDKKGAEHYNEEFIERYAKELSSAARPRS